MSGILDQYGNPVCAPSRHFAKGADRYDRSTPPTPLFKDSFDKLIPNLDRQALVSVSRMMFQNFGPVTGAIMQKADNVVGRAWAPRFTGTDAAWGNEVKDWLESQWYGTCDVRGRTWDFKTLLWLDSVAIDRDGDFLIHLTESESGYPQTQRISVNRIGQRFHGDKVPDGPYKDAKCSHGVIRNKFDRPIAYIILGDTQADDETIPADRLIHVFDPTWHDQVRGIPSFSNAVKLIDGSMTATEREQLNQLVRSSISLVEYNETGGPDIDDPSITIGSPATATEAAQPSFQSFAGGMIKYFRSNSGGKIESVDNDTPGDMWDRFQDRVVRTAMTGINWPYELAWKANEINAALVRNIQERARYSVEDRQDVIKAPALFTIRYAIAKAIKAGILPAPRNTDDRWKWDFQMPRKFSVDQAKDSQQRREDWKLGFRSRAQIAAEDGWDVEQVEDEKINDAFRLERKIREREAAEGFEIDRRTIQMLTSNETPAPEHQPGERNQQEEDEE